MKNAIVFALLIGATSGIVGCDEIEFLPDIRDTKVDNANLLNADRAPVTPLASVPTGLVTYDGVFAATTGGDYVGSLYADISMDVDFTAGDVTGTITNADLIDDFSNEVVQDLQGTLALNGVEAAGGLVISADGQFTGLPGGEVEGISTAGIVLSGNVRSDMAVADTVYGTMTAGGMTGDFDLTLSNGEFYGTTN